MVVGAGSPEPPEKSQSYQASIVRQSEVDDYTLKLSGSITNLQLFGRGV